MDIKEKVEEIIKTLTSNEDLMKKFNENPVKVIEGLVGVDLPDDQINQVVNAVKAKIKVDSVSDVIGTVGKLLGK